MDHWPLQTIQQYYTNTSVHVAAKTKQNGFHVIKASKKCLCM